MIKERIEAASYRKNFEPSGNISDRETWEQLPEEVKNQVVRMGEEHLNFDWGQILASDYMEFSKNGNRSRFEEKQFRRRRALDALVLAECVENKGRFLKDIIDGIYCILEESTWCLPAHNSYIRDTTPLSLADYTRPVLDLFAGETGAVLALTEYLLRPVLLEVSPLISRDINQRLSERVFAPYQKEHFWWMGDGVCHVNNWTSWITQNVMLTAFTRPEESLSTETKEKIMQKAAISVDYFLNEYGEDGCCDEGAQYFGHAGLTLFGCLTILNEVTEGGLEDVFKLAKIQNIAAYIRKVHVSDQYYVNFADCSPIAGRRSAREYLFGKRVGDDVLASFAAEDFKKNPDPFLSSEDSLYYRLLQIENWEAMMQEKALPETGEDCYFESAGLMISRDNKLLLAVKAGDNDDSHNHNDVGSFTVYKEGKPMFIDLGVETYCQKTFSDRRYEIWTMQSRYHNLPSFDEFMQQAGEDFTASEVAFEKTDLSSSLQMELAGAYRRKGETEGVIQDEEGHLVKKAGAEKIVSYKRKASLIKGEKITIEDAYEGELNAVLNLMTYEKPEVRETKEGEVLLTVGNLGICRIIGASSVEIETLPITDARLGICWKHEVYRIKVPVVKKLRLEIA